MRADEGPDTFSPYEVIGHLIHGEKTDWIPRARIILQHGTARPFDRYDRFAQRNADTTRPIGTLLDEFAAARRASLAALDDLALAPADLDRQGTHPVLGTVTLGQLLSTWAAHDLTHLAQIARVMARTQTSAVGPWLAFFTRLKSEP